MKKLALILCLFSLSGCWASDFFLGEVITLKDPVTGEVTITRSTAPVNDYTGLLAGIGGTAGAAVIAALKLAQKAAKARDAQYEINHAAIADADWKKINTGDAFKQLLADAHDMHDDVNVIRDSYDKWKVKKDKQKLAEDIAKAPADA